MTQEENDKDEFCKELYLLLMGKSRIKEILGTSEK